MNEPDAIESRVVELHAKHSIPIIAALLEIDVVEVAAALRRRRILTTATAYDLQFILQQRDLLPAAVIRERLALTRTQYDQVLSKRLGLTGSERRRPVTAESAADRTRWLVEQQLRWSIDDLLPRRISNTEFNEHGLYSLIRHAEATKQGDPVFRHFPAVAWLVEQAYPERFRSYQFRHAKSGTYFSGREGRRTFLRALRWLVEEKLQLELELLPILAQSHDFLNTRKLQDYGLGSHYWRPLFGTEAHLISELLKFCGVSSMQEVRGTTARLRDELERAERPVERCELPGCTMSEPAALEIHHIIRRSRRMPRGVGAHDPRNLIALCATHHRLAERLPVSSFEFA